MVKKSNSILREIDFIENSLKRKKHNLVKFQKQNDFKRDNLMAEIQDLEDYRLFKNSFKNIGISLNTQELAFQAIRVLSRE